MALIAMMSLPDVCLTQGPLSTKTSVPETGVGMGRAWEGTQRIRKIHEDFYHLLAYSTWKLGEMESK